MANIKIEFKIETTNESDDELSEFSIDVVLIFVVTI